MPTEQELIAEARKKIKQVFRDDGPNMPIAQGAKDEQDKILEHTIVNAMKTVDTTEWTDRDKKDYILRHVRIMSRVAKNFARAADRNTIEAEDVRDAARGVILRAQGACDKQKKKNLPILLGVPCKGYAVAFGKKVP